MFGWPRSRAGLSTIEYLKRVSDDQVVFAELLNRIEAWKAYRRLASDSRIRFLSEPLGIETAWHELTRPGQPATNVRTDAYLQAFGTLSSWGFKAFR